MLVNLLPKNIPYRDLIEQLVSNFKYILAINPTELEKHVIAVLKSTNKHQAVEIVKGIHVGAYGDLPHFNIRTPYTNDIHVYVQFDFNGAALYLTMTSLGFI